MTDERLEALRHWAPKPNYALTRTEVMECIEEITRLRGELAARDKFLTGMASKLGLGVIDPSKSYPNGEWMEPMEDSIVARDAVIQAAEEALERVLDSLWSDPDVDRMTIDMIAAAALAQIVALRGPK